MICGVNADQKLSMMDTNSIFRIWILQVIRTLTLRLHK